MNVTGQLQSLAEIIEEEFLKLRKQLLQSLTARKVEPKSLIDTLAHCDVYSTEKEPHTIKLFQLHKKRLIRDQEHLQYFLGNLSILFLVQLRAFQENSPYSWL